MCQNRSVVIFTCGHERRISCNCNGEDTKQSSNYSSLNSNSDIFSSVEQLPHQLHQQQEVKEMQQQASSVLDIRQRYTIDPFADQQQQQHRVQSPQSLLSSARTPTPTATSAAAAAAINITATTSPSRVQHRYESKLCPTCQSKQRMDISMARIQAVTAVAKQKVKALLESMRA